MFYHALTGNGGTEDLEPVLLWENSSPTAAFNPQTISLDLTDYAGVIIEFNESAVMQTIAGRLYCKKTDNYSRFVGVGFVTPDQSQVATSARCIIKVDNNGVEFGNSATNNAGNNQTILIPIRIYGVKEYIVEPAVGDLLWHNDNPTTALDTKEIAGDYSKYSKLYVEGRLSVSNDYKLTAILEKSNSNNGGIAGWNSTTNSLYRIVAFTDSNISIKNCNSYDSSSITQYNSGCIITNIYGIE